MSIKGICNALFYGNIIWGCVACWLAATNPWWLIAVAINATVAWRLHVVLSRMDAIDKYVETLTDDQLRKIIDQDQDLKDFIDKEEVDK